MTTTYAVHNQDLFQFTASDQGVMPKHSGRVGYHKADVVGAAVRIDKGPHAGMWGIIVDLMPERAPGTHDIPLGRRGQLWRRVKLSNSQQVVEVRRNQIAHKFRACRSGQKFLHATNTRDTVGSAVELWWGPHKGKTGTLISLLGGDKRRVRLDEGPTVEVGRDDILYKSIGSVVPRGGNVHRGPRVQMERGRKISLAEQVDAESCWAPKHDLRRLRKEAGLQGRSFTIGGVTYKLEKFMEAARKHKIWIRGNATKVLAEFKRLDHGRMVPIDPESLHKNWSSQMLNHWYDWCEDDEKHLDNRNGFTYQPVERSSTTLPLEEFEKANSAMHNESEIVDYWVQRGWPSTTVKKELHRKRKRDTISVETVRKLPKQFMTHADFRGYIASKGKKGAKEFLQQTFNMSAATFKAQTRVKRRKVVTTKEKTLLEVHVKPVRDWIEEEREKSTSAAALNFSSESWQRAGNDIDVVYAGFKKSKYYAAHITKLNFRKMVEYVEGKVEHHFVEGTGAYSKNTKGNIAIQIGPKKKKKNGTLDEWVLSSSSSSSNSSL
tara:strand:+ start:1272 stop:2918 length:1647 start_codon:yes stop_codon:yes gene_type:complete